MAGAGLLSWGNHPRIPQTPHSCHWRDALPAELADAQRAHGSTLPFGNGRSYGDSCLAASDHVMHLKPLDRFMSVDWQSGVLVAEAGVSLEDILNVAIPRGWFVPVTPGTKHVTLGGAIANDVHGKNHHRRGAFGRYVRALGLLRSDSGRQTLMPGSESSLFAATVGGLGLTGLIEWAELQLVPIRASELAVLTHRFDNLDEFFALSGELDAQHEFCVSWIDCTARGRATGRGVFMAGDFAADGALAIEVPRKLAVPLTPPVSLVNGLSLRAFNTLYWRKAARGRRSVRMGYEPFFYPLDGLLQWNRLYGPRGFQQYQCLIPENCARPAIRELLEAIAASGLGSFLAVLKRCGDLSSPGILSFPQAGVTLALDFPQNDRLASDLFPRLDAIVRAAAGRLYPAKDAHMTGEDFRRAYPRWREVDLLRDPALMSRFWQRVTT